MRGQKSLLLFVISILFIAMLPFLIGDMPYYLSDSQKTIIIMSLCVILISVDIIAFWPK